MALRGNARAGVGVLLAYEGYLRVSELLGLRREHVLLPAQAAVDFGVRDTHCGLHLPSTKRGVNQFVRIVDPAIIRYLQWLVSTTPPGGLLFPALTPRKLNHLIRVSLRLWGLPDDFSMHSLRHGRAAAQFLADVHPDVIRREGRWSVLFSMEPYLQAALALTLQLRGAGALGAAAFLPYAGSLRPFLVELSSLVCAAQ